MSEFLFTLQTGLDIIDIISNAATTQVILVVIQGCVMPRMCYVAPKALPKLDLSRVPIPHTLAGRVIYLLECTLRNIKQFYYTTIFLCTNSAINGTCFLKSSVPDPRRYDTDPHPRIRI